MLGVSLPARQRLLAMLCCALFCASGLAFAAPVQVSADLVVGGTAVVITTEGDPLSVRSGPGRQHAVVGTLPQGTVVALTGGPETSADGIVWFQVRWRSLAGWSSAEWLGDPAGVAAATQPDPPAAPPAEPSVPPAPPAPSTPPPAAPAAPAVPAPASGPGPKITGTNGVGARLRAAPSLKAATVLLIPEGATVEITGTPQSAEGYEWMPVRYSGQSGWVASSLLSASAIPAPNPEPTPPPVTAPAPNPEPTPTTGSGPDTATGPAVAAARRRPGGRPRPQRSRSGDRY